MADSKLSQLNSLTKSTIATTDLLYIADVSVSETKKMTYQELIQPTDANFRIAGSSDTTKLVAFEVDGLTTGTTRTITVPDANMTLVGQDTTQTLTNKTLTAPQINMGSDATGDMYYRTGAGAFARLPIGTSGQIIQTSAAGIPEWVANPSVSAATTIAAGIVELATTAETETGTDATRAVTPDGLHDMTTLAGAAWFLDEDTMASDSAIKTVSQQSVKAYVDTSINNEVGFLSGVGSATRVKSYWNFQIPFIISTDVPTNNFWSTLASSYANFYSSIYWGASSDTNASITTANPVFMKPSTTTGSQGLLFSDGKDVIVEFGLECNATGSEQLGWGLSTTNAPYFDYDEASADAACFTVDAAGALYAHTSSGGGGANHTETLITGITLTDLNTYRIEFNPGVDVKFYVNGVLKATNTTNLPNSGSIYFGFGAQGNTNANDLMNVTAPWFAIEK